MQRDGFLESYWLEANFRSARVLMPLTHWGRVTHQCIGKLISITSDNGLSPGWHQAIIRTNAGILLIGPLWINFSEFLIEIRTFSLKKIRLKMSSAKCRPFSFGLNVLSNKLLSGPILAETHDAKWPQYAIMNITWWSVVYQKSSGWYLSSKLPCPRDHFLNYLW